MSSPRWAQWAQSRLARALGHHYAFVLTRWGFGKSLATVLARAGSQKLALGAVASGATGLTIHHQTKERHERHFGGDVLSSGQEVEWLNAAIKPIWDHLDAGVRKIIQDELEPELKQRAGPLGSVLKFSKSSLGSSSPRFGPVRVTRSAHGLEINVGFSLEGNGTFEFGAGVASIEVRDITVSGTLRVGLQPLLESMNPVGGVSVTCLDRPVIDLNIKTSADIIPNLYNFVRDTVDDVVAGLIVIPNMVAVSIDGEVDAGALQHPPPLGFLRLTVEGLEAAKPLPPVYLEVMLGAKTWQSPTRSGHWQEEEVDMWVYSQDQLLRIRAFASHTFGTQLIASGQVHVRDLMPGKIEVPLTDVEDHGETFSVQLHLNWLPVLQEAPSKGDPFLASVHLQRLRGLRGGRHRLRVTLGEASHLSREGEAEVQHCSEERLLTLAKKLHGKLPLIDLANVLELPVAHVRDFALEFERHRRKREELDEGWAQKWCQAARQAADDLAAGQEPYFDDVYHLRGTEEDVLVIELLKEDGQCAARLERDLASIRAAGGVLKGPFELALAEGSCTLEASVRLRGVELPTRRDKLHEQLLSESSWHDVPAVA